METAFQVIASAVIAGMGLPRQTEKGRRTDLERCDQGRGIENRGAKGFGPPEVVRTPSCRQV